MQIRRDREDELIHREMQYRRAIRRFIKQTGRYPMNLEDLDKGQVRYLRKRYKDPITGRDFKLLHMLDIPQPGTPTPNLQQGSTVPGADPADATATSGKPGSAASSDAASTTDGQAIQPQPGQSGTPQAGAQPPNAQAPGGQFGSAQSTNGSSNQPVVGGLIVGVVSTSTKTTIREFNHKNRYNQWLFFYDPAFDRFPEFYGPTPIGINPTAMFGPGSTPGQQPPGSSTPQPTGSSFGQPQPPQTNVPQQPTTPQ
jgi:hypothetical protein